MDQVPSTHLKVLPRLLRSYLRSGMRGQTRVSTWLAHRCDTLQAVPIQVLGNPPVFVDLRYVNLDLLRDTPLVGMPVEAGEQLVMRSVVRPGDTVLDIGASLGFHAVHLAKLVGALGRVACFEPNPRLVANLKRTLDGLGNATLYPVALSDRECQAQPFFVPVDEAMASLRNWTVAPELSEWRASIHLADVAVLSCKSSTLDGIIAHEGLGLPSFCKCDVEGAELLVFKGGQGLLDREDAPVVMYEIDAKTIAGFGWGIGEASEYLLTLPRAGYEIFEVTPRGRLVAPASLSGYTHANLLAVPRARREAVLRATAA